MSGWNAAIIISELQEIVYSDLKDRQNAAKLALRRLSTVAGTVCNQLLDAQEKLEEEKNANSVLQERIEVLTTLRQNAWDAYDKLDVETRQENKRLKAQVKEANKQKDENAEAVRVVSEIGADAVHQEIQTKDQLREANEQHERDQDELGQMNSKYNADMYLLREQLKDLGYKPCR